jgi:hypothetical protein
MEFFSSPFSPSRLNNFNPAKLLQIALLNHNIL